MRRSADSLLSKTIITGENDLKISSKSLKIIQRAYGKWRNIHYLHKKSETLFCLSPDLLPSLSPSLAQWKLYQQVKPGAQGCFVPSCQSRATVSAQEEQVTRSSHSHPEVQAPCCRLYSRQEQLRDLCLPSST